MASLVVNTFPQAFLEVLHQSLQHVGRNCCHFFPDVLFQIHRCPWFLFVHLALEISSEEAVLRLGTLVPINIEVPTKYPLSEDRIVVFEIRLHSKSPMLYRPALNDNWNALSLARRALKDKFPTPTVPLTTVLQNRQVFLKDPVQIAWLGSEKWCSRKNSGHSLTLLSNESLQATSPPIWPSSLRIKIPLTELQICAHAIHSALFRISGAYNSIPITIMETIFRTHTLCGSEVTWH